MLPSLVDAYGFYYNLDLLQAAGYSGPPTTYDELTAMAEKLTTFNADGSINVAGFIPLSGWYENSPNTYAPSFGVTLRNAQGQVDLASQPAAQTMFQWSKNLIDFYGYDKVQAFTATAGNEWNAENAFETGKVAMILDGEWRTQMIAADVPSLNYGTGPLPTGGAATGPAAAVGAAVAGVAKTSKNPEAAWELVKWLSTSSAAQTYLAEQNMNVPASMANLSDPVLAGNENFKPFLDLAALPTSQLTDTPQAAIDIINTFAQNWESGAITGDLGTALQQLDDQANAALAQGQTGTAP